MTHQSALRRTLRAGAMLVLAVAACVAFAQEPRRGGTIVVGLAGEPSNIDVLSGSLLTGVVTNLVCEGLIADDVTAVGETFAELIPVLASSWSVSDDGTVYTFPLRQGVRFHDGTPFDAHAVVLNFDRFMKADSPVYDAVARAAVSSRARRIADYRAVDDHTFEITLSTPFGSFLRNFKHRAFAIVSPAALEAGVGQMSHEFLSCTGPFRMSSREQGVRIVLDRNPDYWDNDNRGGGPYVDQVIFQVIPDASARIAALQTGQIDIDIDIPADRVADLSRDRNVVVELPGHPHVYYLVPNIAHPATADLRVRQAIWHAIDVDGMVTSLFGDTAIPLHSLMPPGNPAYRPGLERPYGFDPERARALLAEAGYASGLTLEYMFPMTGASYMDSPQFAQWIQSNLRDVGVTVVLRPLEVSAWSAALRPGMDTSVALAINGIQSVADDPNFMEQYFHSGNHRPAGSNFSFYVNHEVDALFDIAAVLTEEAAWVAAHQAAEDALLRDAAVIPLAHFKHPKAYGANVRNLRFGPSFWFDLTEVWLAN
jgi:peptide/nickel transport system substrate-binding protein